MNNINYKKISTPYGQVDHLHHEWHRGVDIAGHEGTPIPLLHQAV